MFLTCFLNVLICFIGFYSTILSVKFVFKFERISESSKSGNSLSFLTTLMLNHVYVTEVCHLDTINFVLKLHVRLHRPALEVITQYTLLLCLWLHRTGLLD